MIGHRGIQCIDDGGREGVVHGIASPLSTAEEAGMAEAMVMETRDVGAGSSCVNNAVAMKEVQGMLLLGHRI